MDFPEKSEDFLKSYSFKDRKEEYTNGDMLIQTFRVEQMIEHYFGKPKEYENLKEQGRLLRLPCSIGADVYMIPSKTNYLLNIFGHREKLNKIYHQNVERITFTKRGWYMECDKDAEYGTGKILVDTSYGVTWFLSHEEAEAKLKEIEESL